MATTVGHLLAINMQGSCVTPKSSLLTVREKVNNTIHVNHPQNARARENGTVFLSKGTSVTDRGTPRPLIVLSKWNNDLPKRNNSPSKRNVSLFGMVSDASVNFHFDAMRSFQSKEGKIK